MEKKKTNPTSNSGVQRKTDEVINVVALKGNGGGDSSERQQAAWEGGREGGVQEKARALPSSAVSMSLCLSAVFFFIFTQCPGRQRSLLSSTESLALKDVSGPCHVPGAVVSKPQEARGPLRRTKIGETNTASVELGVYKRPTFGGGEGRT